MFYFVKRHVTPFYFQKRVDFGETPRQSTPERHGSAGSNASQPSIPSTASQVLPSSSVSSKLSKQPRHISHQQQAEPVSPHAPLVFKTEGNRTVPAVTPAQMQRLWQITAESGPSQYQIMENAGRSLAQVALKFLKAKQNKDKLPKVVVLVGAGCCGATGLCAARHLANHQIQVVACLSRGYQLSDEVIYQRNLFKQAGGREGWIGSLPVETVDLIIDSLVGVGLRGPAITGPTVTLIQWANGQGAPILSLEMPSGHDPITGRASGPHISAHATLTVGLPKVGHLKEVTGQLYCADIGVPAAHFHKAGIDEYAPFFEDSFVIKLHTSKKI